MMDRHYLKLNNQNFFSPKYIRGYSSNNIKSRKLLNNFPKTTKYSNDTTSDFYSSKNHFHNKSNLFFASNSNINIFTPKQNILKNNYRNIRSSKPRIRSSFQKKLPSVNNNPNKNMSQNKFCLETEKLYHETYQIKKVIKQLEKELFYLSHENLIKDEQLNEKEQEINNIINNNYKTFDDEYNDDYNVNYNNFNMNDININNVNSSMGVLILKIKKEIKNTNNEIKKENFKLDYLKRSLYITKIKELNIESKLLQQQYSKINTLIDNALDIKDENDKTLEEFENLKENINRQKIILSNLGRDCSSLEKEEHYLNNQLLTLKNELKTKIEKAKKNNNELNELSVKSKNLNNDKIMKSQTFTTKIDGMPITIKSLYTNKVSELRKNINFYKKQCNYTEDMVNKLKEQRKKLIDANKNFDQKIKISQNFLENSTKLKNLNRPISSLGVHKQPAFKDEEIINNLKSEYKTLRANEIVLEQKANTYFEKLREIDFENEEKERKEKENEEENQIEFGIDENNPYYTDNEENVPESNIKFTSTQFNQFTYILFKNFEAKFIVAEEANNKIINPFYELIKKNNIEEVNYPSKEFDNIIEEFTKIIMKELNSDNEYNHILTKIFIGALLYNSECDTNKLVEYFSILFGYTRNYIIEEKKLIDKLKTKYKNETKKLVECITSYILNDLSSSQYFSLFKMKDLLDKNEINLKDKYIEFLFYYMKKFNDPDAKLEDLKFSLLNDIVPIGDTNIHSKEFINDLDKEIDLGNNEEENLDGDIKDINGNKKEYKETGIENEENGDSDEKNKKKVDKKINKDIKGKFINDEKKENGLQTNKNENNESKKDDKDDKGDENINKENINTDNIINDNIDVDNFIKEKENKEIEDEKKFNESKNKINENINVSKSNEDINDIDIDKDEIKNKSIDFNTDDVNKENNMINNNDNNKNLENNNYKDNNIINNEKKEIDINGNKELENKNINIENIELENNDNNNQEKEDEKENINNIVKNNVIEKDENKNNDKLTENEKEKINNSDKINESNDKNNKIDFDQVLQHTEKNENNNDNNSENNHNNEPVVNNETEKEEILETGNYENKKNKSKDKDKSKEKNESKENTKEEEQNKNKPRKKYKEDEYIMNSQNEDCKNNDIIEDEKFKNDNSNIDNDDTNLKQDEDSVTEITNEEYKKQIIESINLIQISLQNNSTDFNSLMGKVIYNNLVNGEFYEYINVEDFNEKLISIGVNLTDLQLSCLCSKFSIPNELRLIDKKKFEKSLEDNLNGVLKIE